MTARDPEFCPHEHGLVMGWDQPAGRTGDDLTLRCQDCRTAMTIMPVAEVGRLQGEVDWLREENQRLAARYADCRKGLTQWEDKP